MSFFHAQQSVFKAQGGDVVTLSGESVFNFSFGSNAFAWLKIDNDGNVYRQIGNAGYVQVDTLTDWVRPASSSPGAYQVRYTNLLGDALVSASAAEDVWLAMSIGDFVLLQRTFSGPIESFNSTFTIEIREGTGAVLDSGLYSLNVEREDF